MLISSVRQFLAQTVTSQVEGEMITVMTRSMSTAPCLDLIRPGPLAACGRSIRRLAKGSREANCQDGSWSGSVAADVCRDGCLRLGEPSGRFSVFHLAALYGGCSKGGA